MFTLSVIILIAVIIRNTNESFSVNFGMGK